MWACSVHLFGPSYKLFSVPRSHNRRPEKRSVASVDVPLAGPNSGMWHFVNLPLGTVSYEFTSSDDVIHGDFSLY